MNSQAYLSTKAVARLMNVAETTVKRWADDETLRCIRTPGGHRKFALRDVVAFAETHAYPLTGLLPPPATQVHHGDLEKSVLARDFNTLASILTTQVLAGDRKGTYDLLMYLYTQQIEFIDIADRVIRPAMEDVGQQWVSGTLEVDQEHVASQTLLEALLRFAPTMHRKTPNGHLAVCSCVEGEGHSLGLRCVAYALECDGWTVHMLGADTPFRSLHSHVKRVKPNLVCLSSSLERKRKDHTDAIRSMTKTMHRWNGAVVVGGRIADTYTHEDLGSDLAARSLGETVGFARDRFHLKPGPKPGKL